jgi:23S rRNA pseudouridine1911/1915/1917 synthase
LNPKIISTEAWTSEPWDGTETDAEVEVREVVFTVEQHGLRIDRCLADLIPEFSRSYLQQLLERGDVEWNGRVVGKVSQRVAAGDTARVCLRPTPQAQAFRAEAMPLVVVYEDPHLLVVDKPAGLVVHPAPGNWSGTLLNGLLAHHPGAAALPRAGIVHRLDKDTSGLMVVAKTRPAMDGLVRSIAQREVVRLYLAVTARPWTPASDHLWVRMPVGRDPAHRLRMAALPLGSAHGKPATTLFKRLEGTAEGCLIGCKLFTGRTHQIRVHLAASGMPIAGDTLYGGFVTTGVQRQALHAARLGFVHPVTGQDVSCRAPWPGDIQALISEMRLHYNEDSFGASEFEPYLS